MWSCRLNKIKSSRTEQEYSKFEPSCRRASYIKLLDRVEAYDNFCIFLGKMGRWQYLLELFLAGNIVALVLALAQAQSWQALSLFSVMQHVLFINWILLAFAAFSELFAELRRVSLSMKMLMFSGFVLLQALVLFTTLILNVLIYLGENFSLAGLNAEHFNC